MFIPRLSKFPPYSKPLLKLWAALPIKERHFPFNTVDVVYTWKYGGPHILNTICANEMKLCVYNA